MPVTRRWAGLVGLFLLVFGVAALTGPGRIDILDGGNRYEVGRSLVDHGDLVVRDPEVTFLVAEGRGGARFSYYRLPQSLLGAVAIAAADLTGPTSEPRRQFFFTLTSAAMGGLLAMGLAVWFRQERRRGALAWALGGVLCTPAWFYATSTFDEILGTAALIWVLVLARQVGRGGGLGWALAAGLVLGWLFNVKQPLAVVALPALALAWRRDVPLRHQWRGLALVVVGLALGIAAYEAYQLYKWPPGSTGGADVLEGHIALYGNNPLMAYAAWTFSPSASFLLYCPPSVLGIAGVLVAWRQGRRVELGAMAAAALVYTGFVSTITFFKGDPCWGPRYLTPVLVVLWLYAPLGAPRLPGLAVRALLVAGLAVQLLALSVDPHRLYVERSLPNVWSASEPVLLFFPNASHLLHRPREIVQILGSDATHEAFTPSTHPTSALPMAEEIGLGPEHLTRFAVLDSLRPWWHAFRHLPPAQRPVHLGYTALVLGLLILAGATLVLSTRGRRDKGADGG